MMTTNTDIGLAHDSFTQYGGAERVFEAVHELYPQSKIYTLVKDPALNKHTQGWNMVTSPLQLIYDFYPHLQHLFGFIPVVFSFWKPQKEKVLLSFSSSFIKGLKKMPGTVHINYCHTPTRFLWVDPQHAYKEIPNIFHPLAKLYFTWLKKWDLRAVQKIDFFIANSREVQNRIKKFYNRDSKIIYPFINTNFWKPTIAKQNYFLIAGRLQYAKGLDLVIQTFNELGVSLHVVGTGRFENELKRMAKPNIKFLGKISDTELRDQYSGAKGFIYPQYEDFGLMPLEAASCGTATLGLAKGGSLETIQPGQTGELLEVINRETLSQAVTEWNESKYLTSTLTAHSNRFSKEKFQTQLQEFIKQSVPEVIHG